MAGQTINDRLLAARHSLAGQGLAKAVCKATTEEMIGPKKKHLDYLVQCTNEPNVSIPQLANLLIERSQNTNWIVVYKALITVHHMMCYGNERFTQYLASSNSTFQLSNFLDKSGLQGVTVARVGYDMSPFIRRYSRYLNEKALSYRIVAFDFCKVKRGKEDGALRVMNAEKLLKTIPTLQNQLDALLEFDCSANNLTNGVINVSFMLLFRDLIRLFACYNDGVINLLEKYFDMNKKQCREALDLYKKFLIRMDRVAEFLKVAENVGIDKGDIPDLTKAPSSLLDALEQHLAAIEGKKSSTTTPTQSSSNQKNIKSGVSALSSTSSAFGTAAINGRMDSANGIDETLKQQVLAEEEAAMSQYKSKVHSPSNSTNPFLNAPISNSGSVNTTTSSSPAVDLFSVPPSHLDTGLPTKASDDLLQLSNPFADVFTSQPTVPTLPMQSSNIWMANGNGFVPQQMPGSTTSSFVSESNFNTVFGTTESSAANDGLNPFYTSNEAPSLLLDERIDSVPASPIIDLFTPIKCCDEKSEQKSCPLSPVQVRKSVPPPRPPPPVVAASQQREDPVIPDTSLMLDDDDLNKNVMMTFVDAPDIVGASMPMGDSLLLTGEQPSVLPVAAPFTGFDGLGDVLQPASSQNNNVTLSNIKSTSIQQQTHQGSALLTGDLESSLASLAENLSINRSVPVKGVQWNSPKNGAKPGTNWTPQPMAATTGAGYRPMGQGMINIPSQQIYPQMQPMSMRPMMAPVGGMTAVPATNPSMAQQQSLLFH